MNCIAEKRSVEMRRNVIWFVEFQCCDCVHEIGIYMKSRPKHNFSFGRHDGAESRDTVSFFHFRFDCEFFPWLQFDFRQIDNEIEWNLPNGINRSTKHGESRLILIFISLIFLLGLASCTVKMLLAKMSLVFRDWSLVDRFEYQFNVLVNSWENKNV